ncbi:amidase domain-containing protein [Brevibacillus humidisoli]|uniref:amidase domain-containing protein n=1 Tax=Brevibacillus humidisoli TaxID=2895522 RepID=UPI001E29A2DD|nr:amidase domain-containing protein [Brevibacillus humidisoli]UFJ41308.1 amidase domain-containing protein [Brevibacillus humidisoli]
MEITWIEQMKAYLADVNQTCVDGRSERLERYFKGQQTLQKVREMWQRQPQQNDGNGLIAARLQVVPLGLTLMGEEKAEAVLSLHQRLYFLREKTSYQRERSWVEHVSMQREEDNRWLFLEPWGSFFPDRSRRETESGSVSPLQPDVQETAYGGGYNRRKAVSYAETYWNSYNPAYRHFDVDCTNFVSQCLHAGGIPMAFSNSRSKGWWYRGGSRANWSYSWAVAHALYSLLRSGKAPFYARQVDHPTQLEIGDVICYDFDGDGRWQHNTIVVAKDANNMPLVNAHTTNSRHRYWEYRDSTAYTPNIRYGFFRIRPAGAASV